MKSIFSPWFPATINPARPGWYEVGHDPAHRVGPRSRAYLWGNRRYWDGSTWRAGWLRETVSIMGTHPSHRWRGLTAEEWRERIAAQRQGLR